MPRWLFCRLGWLCGGILPAMVVAVGVQWIGSGEESMGLLDAAVVFGFIWLIFAIPVGLAGAVYLLVLALVAAWLPGPDGRPELILAPLLLVVALFAGLGRVLERIPELLPCVVGGFAFAALAGPVPFPHRARSGREGGR